MRQTYDDGGNITLCTCGDDITYQDDGEKAPSRVARCLIRARQQSVNLEDKEVIFEPFQYPPFVLNIERVAAIIFYLNKANIYFYRINLGYNDFGYLCSWDTYKTKKQDEYGTKLLGIISKMEKKQKKKNLTLSKFYVKVKE